MRLASRGWQVTAVDFSAVGLDKGRFLAENRCLAIDWVRADVRDYQPEPDSFQPVLIAYLQSPEAGPAVAAAGQAPAALAASGTRRSAPGPGRLSRR